MLYLLHRKLLAHYKQSTQYVNATQKETRSGIIGVIRGGRSCVVGLAGCSALQAGIGNKHKLTSNTPIYLHHFSIIIWHNRHCIKIFRLLHCSYLLKHGKHRRHIWQLQKCVNFVLSKIFKNHTWLIRGNIVPYCTWGHHRKGSG